MKASAISPGNPELDLLNKLVEAYAKYPYENISKIIKLNSHLEDADPIRLPEEVVEGHLREGLGGTCFSLTYTLQTILTQNGFDCYPVMAHMRAGRNIHCALVALVGENKYLIDPGYLLGRPVELHPEKPFSFWNQFARVELFYLPEDGAYHLYTFSGQERKWRYSFVDQPTGPKDFLKYWQDSFHKNAMHGICLNRVTPKGLVYVRKRFMRRITPGGKKNVNIKRNYHAAIEQTFSIRKEIVDQALAALEANMAWERRHGLYHPKGKRYDTIGS
ncbi:arylamine N-acetyltransferase [Candidatus Zixiibacteriota bacterium]